MLPIFCGNNFHSQGNFVLQEKKINNNPFLKCWQRQWFFFLINYIIYPWAQLYWSRTKWHLHSRAGSHQPALTMIQHPQDPSEAIFTITQWRETSAGSNGGCSGNRSDMTEQPPASGSMWASYRAQQLCREGSLPGTALHISAHTSLQWWRYIIQGYIKSQPLLKAGCYCCSHFRCCVAEGLSTTNEINTNKKKFEGLQHGTVWTAPVSSNLCESQG